MWGLNLYPMKYPQSIVFFSFIMVPLLYVSGFMWVILLMSIIFQWHSNASYVTLKNKGNITLYQTTRKHNNVWNRYIIVVVSNTGFIFVHGLTEWLLLYILHSGLLLSNTSWLWCLQSELFPNSKEPWTTLIRHRSNTFTSDWCLNDVDLRYFAILLTIEAAT